MFGKYAIAVKIDLEGIEDKEYAYEICDKWSAAMKAAIKKDFESDDCSDHHKAIKVGLHYEVACETVIRDLLFDLKWTKIRMKILEDENQG